MLCLETTNLENVVSNKGISALSPPLKVGARPAFPGAPAARGQDAPTGCLHPVIPALTAPHMTLVYSLDSRAHTGVVFLGREQLPLLLSPRPLLFHVTVTTAFLCSQAHFLLSDAKGP